jgi:hypothetical protein
MANHSYERISFSRLHVHYSSLHNTQQHIKFQQELHSLETIYYLIQFGPLQK